MKDDQIIIYDWDNALQVEDSSNHSVQSGHCISRTSDDISARVSYNWTATRRADIVIPAVVTKTQLSENTITHFHPKVIYVT
jgi:hypothetical protein